MADERFGCSVSLSGNVALVGACSASRSGGADAGSAYLLRYNGSIWVQEAEITAVP
ncbi:MAG: hypothetical protein V2A79_05945 [Planctomycetota bacterium]